MSASTTTTTAPDRPRRRLHLTPRTRKGRVTALIAALVVVPLTAYAVYLYLLGLSGTLSARDLDIQWDSDEQTVALTTVNDGITCVPTFTSNRNLQVNANGYPGGSCTITAGALADGASDEPGVVVGVAATLPAGWALDLDPASCGTVVDTVEPVTFTLSSDNTGASDGSIQDAGVQLVPQSQYDPSLCTP